jgi:hypothetical protein
MKSNPRAVSGKAKHKDSRKMILPEEDTNTSPGGAGEEQSVPRCHMRVPSAELYAHLSRRINQYSNNNDIKQWPSVSTGKVEVLKEQWRLPQAVPMKMARHVRRGEHLGQGSLEDNNTDDIDQNIKIIDLTKESEDEDCESKIAYSKKAYDECGKKLSPVAIGSGVKKRKKKEYNATGELNTARKLMPMAIGSRGKDGNEEMGLQQVERIKRAHYVRGGKHLGAGSFQDNIFDGIDEKINIVDLTKESNDDEDNKTDTDYSNKAYDESGKKLSPVAIGNRGTKKRKKKDYNMREYVEPARKSAPTAIGNRNMDRSNDANDNKNEGESD